MLFGCWPITRRWTAARRRRRDAAAAGTWWPPPAVYSPVEPDEHELKASADVSGPDLDSERSGGGLRALPEVGGGEAALTEVGEDSAADDVKAPGMPAAGRRAPLADSLADLLQGAGAEHDFLG